MDLVHGLLSAQREGIESMDLDPDYELLDRQRESIKSILSEAGEPLGIECIRAWMGYYYENWHFVFKASVSSDSYYGFDVSIRFPKCNRPGGTTRPTGRYRALVSSRAQYGGCIDIPWSDFEGTIEDPLEGDCPPMQKIGMRCLQLIKACSYLDDLNR